MSEENKPKPAERGTTEDTATAIDLLAQVACWIPSLCTAVAHFAGSIVVGRSILGLAPQALCFRLLSRLKNR